MAACGKITCGLASVDINCRGSAAGSAPYQTKAPIGTLSVVGIFTTMVKVTQVL